MKQVQSSIPGLALEVSLLTKQGDRLERVRQAIVEHFQTNVSMHGSKAVNATMLRVGASPATVWTALEADGWDNPAGRLDEWTNKRHDIVQRGISVSVPRERARECTDLLEATVTRVEAAATIALSS